MNDLERLTDDALLALTREDPEAFGVFYERHARPVLAFLRRATGNTDIALDLTAEVFAAALAGAGRYKPGLAPARTWLIGIAKNKLATLRRRQTLERKARRKLGIPCLEFSDAALEGVEARLDAAESSYLEGLAELAPAEREAVTARVIEDREYDEIAAAAGTSEAAIRQRVSRALAKLTRNERQA